MTSENEPTESRNNKIADAAYRGYISDDSITVAEMLKTAGYQTFMSGKWHVGTWKPNWPTNRGFDRYYGIIRGASNYWKPLPEKLLLDQESPVTALPDDFYTTDYFSRNAVKFIEEADPDQPFFLYLAYTAPHWPLQAWPEDIAKYKGKYMKGWAEIRAERFRKQKKLGLFADNVEISPADAECPDWNDIEDQTEWDLKMAVYAAMIDRMDQGIGTLLEKLEEKGLMENTVIMFLSDNGACSEPYDPTPELPPGPAESLRGVHLPWANASNTPFRLFKHFHHEGGSNTPFIVHWPAKINASRIESSYYAHVKDIAATCYDIAEIEYPETFKGYTLKQFDGKSFLPNILQRENVNDETLFLEHEGNRAVHKGDWKLVSYYRDAHGFLRRNIGTGKREGHWELYNLRDDPTELHDRSRENPEIRDILIEEYGRFTADARVTDWEAIQKTLGHIDDESVGNTER